MAEIIYECCRDCRLLDACDPNYNSEPPCFQKAMESQTTAVQQISAEIAALANEMVFDCTDGASVGTIKRYANKLRQLSARLAKRCAK